jgi:hypothetical protein
MNVDESELIGKPLEEVPQREPTADNCMGRKSSGGAFKGYCQAHPGRGTDHPGEGRCKHHGGAANNRGEKNGNYKHGGFSEFFKEDLSEREQAAFDDIDASLADDAAGMGVVRSAATEALLKYKRSGDHRFLREFRQICSEFNLVDNTDQVELDVDTSLSAEEKEQLDSMYGGDGK